MAYYVLSGTLNLHTHSPHSNAYWHAIDLLYWVAVVCWWHVEWYMLCTLLVPVLLTSCWWLCC